MPTPLSRRQLLTTTIAGAAAFAIAGRAQEKNWQAGTVRHLLPGVSHDRLLLKASFVRPMTAPPTLRAGTRKATGVRLDTPASSTRSTSRGWSLNRPINWFSKTPPADLSATRGRSRHFPVLNRRQKDSGCSSTPARAAIPPPSMPTRMVRTGYRLRTAENCFSRGCRTDRMR